MTVYLRVSSVEGVSRESGALEKPGKIPWRQRGGSWTRGNGQGPPSHLRGLLVPSAL